MPNIFRALINPHFLPLTTLLPHSNLYSRNISINVHRDNAPVAYPVGTNTIPSFLHPAHEQLLLYLACLNLGLMRHFEGYCIFVAAGDQALVYTKPSP